MGGIQSATGLHRNASRSWKGSNLGHFHPPATGGGNTTITHVTVHIVLECLLALQSREVFVAFLRGGWGVGFCCERRTMLKPAPFCLEYTKTILNATPHFINFKFYSVKISFLAREPEVSVHLIFNWNFSQVPKLL